MAGRSLGLGPTAADLLQAVVDRQPAVPCDGDILVGAGGFAREAQDRVAVSKQSLGGGVHHLLGEGVERAGGAGALQDRQGNPFSDHRNVTGLKDLPGRLFESSEVLGHEVGVAHRP